MEKVNHKRKSLLLVICLALCSIMFLLFGCGDSGETLDLYGSGLKITTLMEKMVKDPVYTEMIADGQYDIDKYIANDYDTPTQVYTVSFPSAEKFFNTLFEDENNELLEKYKNLSPDLKVQYDKNFKYNDIVTMINMEADKYNVDDDDITQFYSAQLSFDGSVEENIAYLYTFETGMPILVHFENQNGKVLATGHFVLADDLSTLSSTREVFQKYGCTVNNYEK